MNELVKRVANRLGAAWQHPISVGDIHVDIRDRIVFEATLPDGTAVVVKVDTAATRLAKELVVLRTAADGGLPVPAVVFADTTAPGALVLAKIDGAALSADPGEEAWMSAGQ